MFRSFFKLLEWACYKLLGGQISVGEPPSDHHRECDEKKKKEDGRFFEINKFINATQCRHECRSVIKLREKQTKTNAHL